jgi:hypothetical protein
LRVGKTDLADLVLLGFRFSFSSDHFSAKASIDVTIWAYQVAFTIPLCALCWNFHIFQMPVLLTQPTASFHKPGPFFLIWLCTGILFCFESWDVPPKGQFTFLCSFSFSHALSKN